ncbi:hypothetical protein MTO96_016309 [Rhipicephalus appendiculatus]
MAGAAVTDAQVEVQSCRAGRRGSALESDRPAPGQHLTSDHTTACSIMSRRSVPDSPWQNGMPPFGFCQPPFNPMNCGPMWAPQNNLPFMGGSMAPDMMRFGGNISARSNFRRHYDQPDRYRQRQGYNDCYGNRQGGYGRGDRKRPGPSGERSRSPAPKRAAPRRDGARKDQDRPRREGASEEEAAAAEGEEAEASGAQGDDLYDPAEPTAEDAVERGLKQLKDKSRTVLVKVLKETQMKMVIRKVKVPQTRMKREAEKLVQKHRQANLPLKRLPNQWPKHLDLRLPTPKVPPKEPMQKDKQDAKWLKRVGQSKG